MSLLRILVLLWLALVCSGTHPRVVSISSGKIRGITVDGIQGRTVDAFLGIPFGAPTGGQNRFSPPKEASPWDGVFNATQFSRQCYQAISPMFRDNKYFSNIEESEDCLKLNVWAPKPRPRSSAVMVWIYGGGFFGGSSDLPLYNGAKLASSEDVIVVSLNYRLSTYGFLYLAHPLVPGNMGLMDQTLGLQWVKKNIKAFGGDPKRVTIFGESAGGASVGLHLVSPASSGLFQNAILQSGTANSPWSFHPPERMLEKSLLFAEKVGCPVREDGREETVRCLQELSHEKFLDVVVTHPDPEAKLYFRPVIDGNYLPASPDELLSKGKLSNAKNVLLGYTKHDGSVFFQLWASELLRPNGTSYKESELKKMISKVFDTEKGISDLSLDLVRHIYSEWNSTSANYALTFDGTIQVVTDWMFGCPAAITAEQLARNNSVFFYLFSHSPEADKPEHAWLGAYHGSELPYVFGHLTPNKTNQEDVWLSKKVMRYWANFAKTGDPNNEYLPRWAKYKSQIKEYLDISGKDTKMEKVQQLKECSFWENIIPKIEPTRTNQ